MALELGGIFKALLRRDQVILKCVLNTSIPCSIWSPSVTKLGKLANVTAVSGNANDRAALAELWAGHNAAVSSVHFLVSDVEAPDRGCQGLGCPATSWSAALARWRSGC
jgi:hypothetical protein